MTKISQIPLRSDIWDRVFNLFIQTIVDIKDKKKLQAFIEDFFSPTEKIMFAKRLAAAVLLAKGHNYQDIKLMLKISPPTIAKLSIKVKFEGKGLNMIITDVLKRRSSQIFWTEIEELFDFPTKGNYKSPERFKKKYARRKKIARLREEF